MDSLQHCKLLVLTVFVLGFFFLIGCQPQQPLYLSEKGRWQSHYIGKATNIEYPNVDVRSLPEVNGTIQPLTLDNPDPSAMWDLSLEEAIQMALKNSKVIRTLSGVGFSQMGVSGTPGMLLQSPGGVRTVYDPALIESDPRYGQEAALAAFDAQFNASARWTKSDDPLRSSRTGPGTTALPSDQGIFRTGVSKYAAPGTRYYMDHVNQYYVGGQSDIPPTWSSYVEGGFVHPLLRGGGIEFNRIAGPNALPGNYGGVSIARINTDMSVNDFEMATRNLVADVEKAYWNLYYAYHRLESVRSGRDSAYRTWIQTKTTADVGGTRGSTLHLAQSERNYFTFRQETELALNNLYKAEAAMRYILGLTTSDGRLIRPVDDPITAPIKLDWHSVIYEALYRSPELRKQKWDVKRRELELCASRNFLLPRLDFEGSYRVSGAGKNLIDDRYGAYSSMADGNYGGWTLGLTASAPFGWRQEIAGVRNAELNLARARAILQEQELELSHQLGDSFREISLAYQQMQTTLSAYQAANREVQATQTAFETGATTLDQVLQARRWQSESETKYYSSVIEYNLAIMTLHYRKGSLLEYNNVCLVEGPWPGKAYFDAKRRARERDAGHYFNYGFTLPNVVSRGIYQQHQGSFDSVVFDSIPANTAPDSVPNTGRAYHSPPAAPRSTETPEPMLVQPAIPTPILPRTANNNANTPVSFVTPNHVSPNGQVSGNVSLLTPSPQNSSRNMRYVR